MAKWRKHAELRKFKKKKEGEEEEEEGEEEEEKKKIAGKTSEEGDLGWSQNQGKLEEQSQGDPGSHVAHL